MPPTSYRKTFFSAVMLSKLSNFKTVKVFKLSNL